VHRIETEIACFFSYHFHLLFPVWNKMQTISSVMPLFGRAVLKTLYGDRLFGNTSS
jgi:hypothetical protein